MTKYSLIRLTSVNICFTFVKKEERGEKAHLTPDSNTNILICVSYLFLVVDSRELASQRKALSLLWKSRRTR